MTVSTETQAASDVLAMGEPLQEAPRRYLTPASDIFEGAQGWLVLLDLPGVARDSVDLTIEGQVLTIRGDRGQASGYQRSFGLPGDVDRSAIEAGHKDGVLTVRLPKAEAAKPFKIELN